MAVPRGRARGNAAGTRRARPADAEERGYALDDPVALEGGEEREVVAEFLAARETTRLLDEDPDAVSPGDVAAAVNGYRALYEHVLAQYPAP